MAKQTWLPVFVIVSPVFSASFSTQWAGNSIVRDLTDNFMKADTDFSKSKPNSDFFPLENSRKQNVKISRPNYLDVNLKSYGEDLSNNLAMWRGFEQLAQDVIDTDVQILLDQSLANYGNITAEDVELLNFGWQYLLPHLYYDRLNVNGVEWAEIVNKQPLNTGLLYKVALMIRDKEDVAKNNFVEKLSLSSLFKDDFGYILGYRWGIESGPSGEDFNTETLLHLPSDVVLSMQNEKFQDLGLASRLEEFTSWEQATPEAKVAWFTKFLENEDWYNIAGSNHHLSMHGHLMSGAPLPLLRGLVGQEGLETSLIAGLINKTDMVSLRVQELWEAIPTERRDLFLAQSSKLDVSQLLDFHKLDLAILDDYKTELEELWLSSNSYPVPWSNILAVGLKYMDKLELKYWGQNNVLAMGKFLVILSPQELDQIPAENFEEGVLSEVVSPKMTHCQRTSLYKKNLDFGGETLPTLLYPAIPSATLLGKDDSPISAAWAEISEDLVVASTMFSPGQMFAFQKVAREGIWDYANLTSILTINPTCLSSVTPLEFRDNIETIVSSIHLAGPDQLRQLSASLQSLPRHLLMSWLEAVFMRTNVEDRWVTEVLLDRAEEMLNPSPRTLWEKKAELLAPQVGGGTSWFSSLALAGLSCHCIERIETQDTLLVLAHFRYNLESSGELVHMPSKARKCWAAKLRQFLGLKAALYGVTVTSELELLSMLSTSDIRAAGGELLLSWGGEALAGIIHPQVQHEVLMTVGRLPPHFYLNTGVDLSDVKNMANNLLDQMLAKHGHHVTLTHLGHLHNLVPYADSRILEASPSDVKLYVSSVQMQVSKSVCLPAAERRQLRDFLLKGYGTPETWSALDLVELGDLLVVMNSYDLKKVAPTSLRLAAAQLSQNTRYTEYLQEIRGQTGKILYHEACSTWLGSPEGDQSEESLSFFRAWQNLAQFYLLGNHIQVEVIHFNLASGVPDPKMHEEDWAEKLYRMQMDSQEYQLCVEGHNLDEEECYRGLVFFNCVAGGGTALDCESQLLEDLQNMTYTECISSPSFTKDECWIVKTLDLLPGGRSEDVDLQATYKFIMTDMKGKFDAGQLSDEQKTNATRAISETQTMLADQSFAVLGLDKGELSQQEILSILSAYRNSGNMTGEQNLAIHSLAVDTQVKMVQELVLVLGLSPEYLGMEQDQMEELMNRRTFNKFAEGLPETGSTSPELITVSDFTSTIQPSTTIAPVADTSIVETVTIIPVETTTETLEEVLQENELIDGSTTTTTTSTTTTTTTTTTTSTTTTTATTTTTTTAITTTNILETSTGETTFSMYEPNFPMFASLPSMEQVVLTCDSLKAAGHVGSSLTPGQISAMSRTEVLDCFDTLGKLPWPQSNLGLVWAAVRDRAFLPVATKAWGVGAMIELKQVQRDQLLMLENLTPAIATFSPDIIDLDRRNIDGISVLGRLWRATSGEVVDLTQRYLADNSISTENPLTSTEAASLGQLLCGLREDQWISFVTQDIFPGILSSSLARLDCKVTPGTKAHLSTLLLDLYGPTTTWTTSDLLSTGWLASCLDSASLASLPAHTMEGLTPSALKQLDNHQLHLLSPVHIGNLSPHTASFIAKEQLLPHTEVHRRKAFRAVGGEGARVRRDLEEIEEEMLVLDSQETTPIPAAEPELETEPESEAEPEPETEPETTPEEPETSDATPIYFTTSLTVFCLVLML